MESTNCRSGKSQMSVADAVEAKFQTYVDALKEAGSFDAEAQQQALKEAWKRVSSLSAGAKKYIEKASGGDIGLPHHQDRGRGQRARLAT